MSKAGLKNILTVLNRADKVDIGEGRVAYYRYNEVMRNLSALYGVSLHRTIAVFASLSPNNDYHKNLRSTVTLLWGYQNGIPLDQLTVTSYGHCKKRAWEYLHGLDFLSNTKGEKIRNFYKNILNPFDPYPVTIDGHAYNAWRGCHTPLKEVAGGRWNYAIVADDYRQIAERHGLGACQLQAIVWFTWKRVNRILYNGQTDLFSPSGDLWRILTDVQDLKPYPQIRQKTVSKGEPFTGDAQAVILPFE